MTPTDPRSFGAQLKALRETAGYTQDELATIAGLSVHAVSALERGERRRPRLETVRALAAALDLMGATREAFVRSARASADHAAVDDFSGDSLPLPLTALVGRDADVQTLRQWLADPAVRLITLTGPGGVGKTRLALAVAHAIAAESTTRTMFVALAGIRDPVFVASAIAEAFGLSNVSARDLTARARAACADRPSVLVVDNFEHVLEAAPLLVDLLTSIASLRVLVTSRAALHVGGEREYVVGPLALDAGAERMSPADLARAPAVRLFVERVRDVQADFRLTPANGATVTAICRRLDALPLALELAAPWMKVLTAEGLLRRLGQGVLLSTAGPRDLPARQQTMNATVAWSYQLLDADEQRVFRRLGALPGRFPIAAVSAVMGGEPSPASGDEDQALGVVSGLIGKSLLLRADSSLPARPLYQMLETVRAYAALELTASGERDGALEGLAGYCVGQASSAAAGLVGPEQEEWLGRVHDDLEIYYCAMAWLVERGRSAEACDIAWGLWFFWLIRGHAAEGLRWFEQILSLSSLSPAAESRALLGAASMWFTQRELEPARHGVSRALTLARDGGEMELVAWAEDVSARVEHALDHVDAARGHFARSVEAFQALGIAWGTGNALIGMAGVALTIGDDGEAERLLDEAAPVLGHAGPWLVARALFMRAILAVRRGNAHEAIALVRDSLTRIRDLNDKFLFVYALVPLAIAALLEGDAAWAARILGARDAVSEATGVTVIRTVQDYRDGVEREARARLGSDRWALAYAAGRKSSIDVLLKDIESVL